MTAIDENDGQQARRALPNPAPPPVQRPNTPVAAATSTGIAPAQFYGFNPPSEPPPLPHRRRGVGSNLTMFHTVDEPPSYSGYREPELVEDITLEEPVPSLLSETQTTWDSTDWGNVDSAAWGNSSAFGWGQSSSILIERNQAEEDRWWEGHPHRPGPGILPPAVEALLHDPDHALFSVTASLPTNPPPRSTAPTPKTHPPPTEDEVHTAIPHPNAYYCPKDNAWVLISWKSSPVEPPFSKHARHLEATRPLRLQRLEKTPCTEDTYKHHKTHHLHRYAGVTDSSQLTPPYYGLDAEQAMKRKRRSVRIIDDDIDVSKMQVDEIEDQPVETGFALDLYRCCQCPFYCAVSPPIPGVVNVKHWDVYVKDRTANPRVGHSGPDSVANSVAKILG